MLEATYIGVIRPLFESLSSTLCYLKYEFVTADKNVLEMFLNTAMFSGLFFSEDKLCQYFGENPCFMIDSI